MNDESQEATLAMAAAVINAERERQRGIDRTETALEVIDAARFEQARLSWLSRVPVGVPVELTIDHPLSPRVSVQASHSCPLVISGTRGAVTDEPIAINPAAVITARGLGQRHTDTHSQLGCFASWLVSAWDGGWFVSTLTRDGRSHVGVVSAVNSDAFELIIDGERVTFVWSSVLLVRQCAIGEFN
jgi:hypothetical protein